MRIVGQPRPVQVDLPGALAHLAERARHLVIDVLHFVGGQVASVEKQRHFEFECIVIGVRRDHRQAELELPGELEP